MDVRSQILLVATRRFARQGFDGTSLQVIADDVGVRKPSLLHHFPSKAELLRAVIDNLFEHWSETLPRVLEAVTSGRGRFEAMTEELLRFFAEDPDRARLVVRQMMDRPEATREALATKLNPWLRLIADYMRKSQDAGQAQADVDPESYIVHVVTLTIAGVAGLPVLAGAFGMSPEEATPRHLAELKRIARSSLFEEADEADEEANE